MSLRTDSPLAKLPTELRIKIFEQLYDLPLMVFIPAGPDFDAVDSGKARPHLEQSNMHLQTLRISRQLRAEALAVISKEGVSLYLSDFPETSFAESDFQSHIDSIPTFWKRLVTEVFHAMPAHFFPRYLPFFQNVRHLTIRTPFKFSKLAESRIYILRGSNNEEIVETYSKERWQTVEDGRHDCAFVIRHWRHIVWPFSIRGGMLPLISHRDEFLPDMELNPQRYYPFARINRRFSISVICEVMDDTYAPNPVTPLAYRLTYDFDTCNILRRELPDEAGVMHPVPLSG